MGESHGMGHGESHGGIPRHGKRNTTVTVICLKILSFSNSQSAGIYDETWLVGNYGLLLLNSSAITINNCV